MGDKPPGQRGPHILFLLLGPPLAKEVYPHHRVEPRWAPFLLKVNSSSSSADSWWDRSQDRWQLPTVVLPRPRAAEIRVESSCHGKCLVSSAQRPRERKYSSRSEEERENIRFVIFSSFLRPVGAISSLLFLFIKEEKGKESCVTASWLNSEIKSRDFTFSSAAVNLSFPPLTRYMRPRTSSFTSAALFFFPFSY